MGRRKKYPKLPNGYGSIKRLSGKNRTNPYGVYPPTKEFDINGNPVPVKALCYVDDWYKGFTVLTWYKHGEYYPGREKELTSISAEESALKNQVSAILSKYSQSEREIADQKTFREVFEEFYQWRYKRVYNTKRLAKGEAKRTQTEKNTRVAYNNCSELHDKPFRALSTDDLQEALDKCHTEKGLKHSSLELVKTLFSQMYDYADPRDLCDKKYSDYVVIGIEDDDEHGVPFTLNDLVTLWNHIEDEMARMLLIMCYSGCRITEYKTLEVNFEEMYFFGGIKTEAGKNRYIPIHQGILPFVKDRLEHYDNLLGMSQNKFRGLMEQTLQEFGIKKHTPHDCRHTFTFLCDRYKILETDKKLMCGHAFKDVAEKVYLHRLVPDLAKELAVIPIGEDLLNDELIPKTRTVSLTCR